MISFFHLGYPNCDNSLLHGTAPVAPHAPNWAAGPAWNGAHSYAYQSAPAYNQYDDGSYNPQYHAAYNDYTTNDIHGPGGDKYDQTIPIVLPYPKYHNFNSFYNFFSFFSSLVCLWYRYPAGVNPGKK